MKTYIAGALATLGIFLAFGMRSTENVAPIFEPQKSGLKTSEISMLVVGDIMLGRNVQLLSEREGSDYPFRNISEYLSKFDITSGNLEGSIIENATRTPAYTFKLSFPTSSPLALKRAGFNLFSLANNHTVDFGQDGYKETTSWLSKEELDYFGSPVSEGRGYVKRLERGGKSFAFFGYNATYPSFNEEAALADISAERAEFPDELIFVFMHWGEEYSLSANDFQKQLARKIIDAGSTAIFGSHPHVVEEVEVYKNRAIFYSLGNFIFDQYFSKDTQEELMVGVKVGDKNISYELIPVESKKSQPELMTPDIARIWLKELSARSDIAVSAAVSLGFLDLPL